MSVLWQKIGNYYFAPIFVAQITNIFLQYAAIAYRIEVTKGWLVRLLPLNRLPRSMSVRHVSYLSTVNFNLTF